MDIVYFFRHSPHDDVELRYSLRSVAAHYPSVGKVWILGDRPRFLADDVSRIEHLPWSATGRLLGFESPQRNFFRMLLCAAVIADLPAEFLCFSDDFILLRPWSESQARTIYYLEDLCQVRSRGSGLWTESLWRTFDVLQRLGYPGYNFETHVPAYFRKRWIIEAYDDLRDWVCGDPWHGILGISSVLNHALHRHGLAIDSLTDRRLRAGFYGQLCQAEPLRRIGAEKAFLNFDDAAFGPPLVEFLQRRFPDRCRYEKAA